MNQKSLCIELTLSVKASLGEVWHSLTDPDELENWWGDGVIIEPKVGGKFQERWEDDDGKIKMASGKIIAAQIKKHISFTWREKDWPKEALTECSFWLEPEDPKNTKTFLKMKHTGWESLPAANRAQLVKDFKVGWNYHLKELKSYLDE